MHFSLHFWIHVFRTVQKLHTTRTIKQVRRFIRYYAHHSYNINTQTLSSGISLNLILNYSPNININAIKKLHYAITQPTTHSLHRATHYCTFRSPRDIGELIINYKTFFTHFHKDNTPECA